MTSRGNKKPNYLFRVLLVVSFGIHVVIFMHIAGLYKSHALTYIELTLKDISKPPVRSIPRPRKRPKGLPKPQEEKRLTVMKRAISLFKPIKMEPAERDLPDSLVEKITMPDVPAVSGLQIADWVPVKSEEISGEYATSNSYLEMVRLKIERHKRYPKTARAREIEGRVTVQFVITPEGEIKDPVVVKSSRHAVLDTAALEAVKNASPFPRPSARLFKGGVSLKITISFELIWRKTQNDL